MSKVLTHLILILLLSTVFSVIIVGGVTLIAMLLYGAGPGWAFALSRAPWIAGCVLIAIAISHGRYVWSKRRRAVRAADVNPPEGADRRG